MNINKHNNFTNNFFNPKLFLQAFLQLKMVGIVGLVCSLAYTILAPIIDFFDSHTSSDKFNTTLYLLDVDQVFSPLIIVIFVIVPLMCILIFNFLTKRKGSDFYHSFPVKRQCIFLSFIAAVISWAIIIILTFTVVFIIMISIFLPDALLDMSTIFAYNANIIISCLLVASVIGIGCSITGTIFSSIATSSIILVAPRFLFIFFFGLIASINPFLTSKSFSILTGDLCNMPAHFLAYPVYAIMDYYSYDTLTMANFSVSSLYTLFLAVVYLIIGCITFKKRPSETAQKAYSHKWLDLIFRIFIGYAISLIAVAIYIEEGFFLSSLIIIFAFALISMFIYEIINSKSLKKSVKGLLFTPVIIVLDVITVILLFTVNTSINHDHFDTDDVEYIYISGLHEYLVNSDIYDEYLNDYIYGSELYDLYDYYADYDYYYYDYNGEVHFMNSGQTFHTSDDLFIKNLDNFMITDSEIIEMVLNAYNKYVDDFSSDAYTDNRRYELGITVDDGLTDTRRVLYLSAKECRQLIDMLINKEEIQTCFSNLPDASSDLVFDCSGINDEQAQNIYKSLKNELDNLGPSQWFEFIKKSRNLSNINFVNIIGVEKYIDGEITTLYLPITSITPETYALYIKYYNENHKDMVVDIVNRLLNMEEIEEYKNYSYDFSTRFCDISEDGILSSSDGVIYNSNGIIAGALLDYINSAEYDDFSNCDWNKYYLCYFNLYMYKNTDSNGNIILSNMYAPENSTGFYTLVEKKSTLANILATNQSSLFKDSEALVQQLPLTSSDVVTNCTELSPEQSSKIYDKLIMEHIKLSPDMLILAALADNNPTFHNSAFINTISAEMLCYGTYFNLNLPVTIHAPEAYGLYLKYYNQNNKDNVLKLIDVLNKQSNKYSADVTLELCDLSGNEKPLLKDGKCYDFSYNDGKEFISTMLTDFLASTEYSDFTGYDKDKYYLCHLDFSVNENEDTDNGQLKHLGNTGYYILVEKDSSLITGLENISNITNREHLHNIITITK